MMLFSAMFWLAVEALAAPRVVVVQSDDLGPYVDPVPAFLEALGEPALVVNLHGRQAEADMLSERLRRDEPKVVVALGAKAAYTAKKALPNTPIVYLSITEPERYGITGSQVTGVASTVSPEAYLSQFVGFFPDVKKIGVLRGPSLSADRREEILRAAKATGVEIVFEAVDSPKAVRTGFSKLAVDVDALWLQPDREILTRESFRTLTEEARRHRLPLLVETDNMVRAGGLFAVVPDYGGLGQQAADMAHRILDGAAPAVVEPERPEAVLVALNLRSIEAAGIPFERLLLDFVDIVVE